MPSRGQREYAPDRERRPEGDRMTECALGPQKSAPALQRSPQLVGTVTEVNEREDIDAADELEQAEHRGGHGRGGNRRCDEFNAEASEGDSPPRIGNDPADDRGNYMTKRDSTEK